MLRLTKKADYGLIAVKHPAERRSASAKEIAHCYGLPLPLLAKVLQKLARQGLLESTYGANGGYRLAREPRMITALEVIRAIDGPTILTTCSTHSAGRNRSGQLFQRPPAPLHAKFLWGNSLLLAAPSRKTTLPKLNVAFTEPSLTYF